MSCLQTVSFKLVWFGAKGNFVRLPAFFGESILLMMLLLIGDAGAEEERCGVFGGESESMHNEPIFNLDRKIILLVHWARVLSSVTHTPHPFSDSSDVKGWNKAPEIDSAEAKWSITSMVGEVSELIGHRNGTMDV